MSILVQLSDTAHSFIEEQVAAGRFTSASDYIVQLVEQARSKALQERVDQMLLEALDSGPGVKATPEYRQKRKAELSGKYDRADKP